MFGLLTIQFGDNLVLILDVTHSSVGTISES